MAVAVVLFIVAFFWEFCADVRGSIRHPITLLLSGTGIVLLGLFVDGLSTDA